MKLVSVGLRLLAILLVLFSPWLEPRTRASHGRSVVYVVDRSDSMGANGLREANDFVAHAWARGGGAKLGVVAFDGTPELVAPVGSREVHPVERTKQADASDLAAAIRLARAALPPEGHRSIVVLSDGRATRGEDDDGSADRGRRRYSRRLRPDRR